MHKIPVWLYLFFIVLLACNKNLPRKADTIMAIQEMNDLATAEYIINKIVKANDNTTWYKFGDRKILISCRGIIKAGIDLSTIKEEDVTTDGKNISMVLPAAKILSINLPAEDIKVASESVDFFRDRFTHQEQNLLMTQAETQIKNTADSLGILQSAENNAVTAVSGFLKQLGYERINIKFQSVSPTPKQ